MKIKNLKNKERGFTLIEALVAFLILVISFSVLIYLHYNSMKQFYYTKTRFFLLNKLCLFMEGEPVRGIKVKKIYFKVRNIPLLEETCSITKDNVTLYFRQWKSLLR